MAQLKYRIATIGSHSGLQIFKGAHDEDFKTIAVCKKGSERPYKMFNSADEIISVNSYKDFPKIQNELIKKNAIIIPHGSFVTYMGYEEVEKLRVLYYGNKKILKWESDRHLEKQWLKNAGLKVPMLFDRPKDIDRLVIVKFMGAEGGKGYFLAKNEKDFNKKIKPYRLRKYIIQEYIESNVDSLGRISARDQIVLPKIDPSYVIVGNIPVVVRESFLPRLIDMGEKVVEVSKKLAPPGLFGPFCLETILTPEEEIYVFEISARIVAGTNPFIEGSPYTWLKYNMPMSTGRRIAIEIKNAIKNNQMKKILG
ncbi:formate--phosphoribosylaminoimidazolecarboxamide ligase [Candidatus Woesearchaeota archaeon]|nr:formate--phosphoribosylaminoimidazolecarboxamide ligase [Candidatus Woesearchaeota archaeon]